ncbi:unnamed protein product [Mucor fragilis]
MNASVNNKKTKAVHKNSNNNKKKKQRTHTKPKHKKKPSPSHRSSTATSIVIATHQPTVQDAPIVFLSTPIPTATLLTLPNNDDSPSPLNETDQDEDQGFYQVEETDYTASAAAIHKMEDTESITAQQQPKSVSTATQVTQVAAPVVGVFGGIALIAAAMFYVVRKRKRNSMLVQDMGSNKKLDFDGSDADANSKHYANGDEMHDISLMDEDEAIMVMGQPPKLTPVANNTTTTMNRHYTNHSTIINVPENHPNANNCSINDQAFWTISTMAAILNQADLRPLRPTRRN